MRLKGDDELRIVRIVDNTLTVAHLCQAIRTEYGLPAATKLVIKAPDESGADVDPTTLKQALQSKAKLAAVLKPNIAGDYQVYALPKSVWLASLDSSLRLADYEPSDSSSSQGQVDVTIQSLCLNGPHSPLTHSITTSVQPQDLQTGRSLSRSRNSGTKPT